MLKKIIKLFFPKFSQYLSSTFFRKKNSLIFDRNNLLFDGDSFLFKKLARENNIYGEYGCGLSTIWMLRNTSAQVISVDSSQEWAEKVKNDNFVFKSRLIIKHIDIGKVGPFGRAISYNKCNNFQDYTDFIWKRSVKPELVLIDGRFRVCCFLTSLKLADPGTKIIFDDYVNRPHYHFIEKYVSRIQESLRQCLFIVPSKNEIDMDSLDKDIELFRFVMD